MEKKEISEITKEMVQEFLTQLGLDGEIKIDPVSEEVDKKDDPKYVEKNYMRITLLGDQLSELIGYKGVTLDSMQVILNTMLSKKLRDQDEEGVRLLFEINDYRENREKYLLSYAQRAAAEVENSGQPLMLPPMKPSERRVIHLALKKEQGITTYSEGDGRERRVVIKKEE